jgi:hypothetical protein
MRADEVVVPLGTYDPDTHLLNGLGAIVRRGDIVRALALTKINVKDEESLLAASKALVQAGYAKIKVRITIDCSGSGLNRAAYSPSFSMPNFAEALRRVRRDCFMSKGDVAAYFHTFPISEEFQNLLVVEYEAGTYFKYMRVPMGFTACPYYASTWSAEFRQWFMEAGLDPAFLMDDWFETGATFEEAQLRMRTLYEILISAGYDMAEDKFEVGRTMVFLGILIDSTSMTCRIERSQAAGFKQQLLIYIEELRAGRGVDIQTIRHVAGKFSWYCEVMQSGRMHIDAWWRYAGALEGWHQHRIDISSVIDETEWWVQILDRWENDVDGEFACRIFNSSEILADPSCFQLVQSDASGIDGFGYVCSSFGDDDYRYFSKTWIIRPAHSHQAELLALLAYVRRDLVRGSLIMWITDSQSCAWTINKGNCDDPSGKIILAEILGSCDSSQCQLFALWIPREVNLLPDHLSHLSYIMRRDEISGSRMGGSA